MSTPWASAASKLASVLPTSMWAAPLWPTGAAAPSHRLSWTRTIAESAHAGIGPVPSRRRASGAADPARSPARSARRPAARRSRARRLCARGPACGRARRARRGRERLEPACTSAASGAGRERGSDPVLHARRRQAGSSPTSARYAPATRDGRLCRPRGAARRAPPRQGCPGRPPGTGALAAPAPVRPRRRRRAKALPAPGSANCAPPMPSMK